MPTTSLPPCLHIIHSRKIKSHKNVQKYFCSFVRYHTTHSTNTKSQTWKGLFTTYTVRNYIQILQRKGWSTISMINEADEQVWPVLSDALHTAAWKHSIWFEAQCFGSRFQSSLYISSPLIVYTFETYCKSCPHIERPNNDSKSLCRCHYHFLWQ